MGTVAEALRTFLDQAGSGKPRSTALPPFIMELFGKHVNEQGYEDLNGLKRPPFGRESGDDGLMPGGLLR